MTIRVLVADDQALVRAGFRMIIDAQEDMCVVAEANGFQMKLAKLHGEFPWHTHEHEDELFHCTEGTFTIELEGADPVTLRTGDVFVDWNH